MPALNIIELNVDNKAHSFARIYSSMIEDEFQRKRAYASIVALYALANTIEKSNENVQKSMTLFRHPKLNEEFEFADFYVNNWHIDVRVLVDGDAFLLPKKHFDNNILPDFYAIVKVDKTLNTASLLGFVNPKTANKQPLDYHYYSSTIDSLIPYSEFLSSVEVQKKLDFAEEQHQTFREKYLTLLDEELDAETKSSILRHIFACPSCRTEFCCFTGFEMVSCNIGKYPELMEDQMLGIVGATEAYNPKYEGKEETISIVDEEEPLEIQLKEEEKEESFENESNDEEQEESLDNELNYEEPQEEISEDVLDDDISLEEESLDEQNEELVLDNSLEQEIEEEEFLVIDSTVEPEIIEETSEPELRNDVYETPEDLVQSSDLNLLEVTEEETYRNKDSVEIADDGFQMDMPSVASLIQLKPQTEDVQEEQSDITEEPLQEEMAKEETLENEIVEEQTGETVSDILDELFNIDDEELYEEPVINEKSVEIEPQQEEYQDEVISLDTYLDDTLIPKSSEDVYEDEPSLDSIDYDNIRFVNDNSNSSSDIVYYNDNNSKNSDPDLEILEENSSEQKGQSEDIENIDFDNVIVDYDEMGNPIYTYITDIPEKEIVEIEDDYSINEKNKKSEIQNLDDYDILDEQYQTYTAMANDNQSFSEVEKIEEPSDFEEISEKDETSYNDDYQNDYEDETIDYPVENSYEENHEGQVVYDDNQEMQVEYEEYEEPQEQQEESQYSANSEFDDENYVDETDESIPEERTSNGNPLIALVVLLTFIAASAFGGYKLYQNFFGPAKNDNVESFIEGNNVVTELDTDEMLSQPAQPDENVDEGDKVTGAENVEKSNNGELLASDSKEELPSNDAANLPKLPSASPSDDLGLPPLTERDLLSVKENSKIINKSIASAFSVNSTPAMVKNINWLCTPQLFTDPVFKAFLQEIDGLLKLNIRKNILNATENPKNPVVSVKMAIDNNGKIEKIVIAESSGSEQIDNIVLQSINESLTGKKSPILKDGKLKADRYHLKVVIKL